MPAEPGRPTRRRVGAQAKPGAAPGRLRAAALAAGLLSASSLPAFPASQVLSTDPDWTGSGRQIFAAFGVSVTGAGDVNGDGYDDLLVGASLFDAGSADEGKVFLYLGSGSGLEVTQGWSTIGPQRAAWLGFTVAAGDVNGDGFGDVLLGAHGYDDVYQEQGIAYGWLGGPELPPQDPLWVTTVNDPFALFGKAMASGGDVNGDGYDDVLVGAFDYNGGEGAAFLYLGGPDGPSGQAAWSAFGGQAEASFGFSVAFAGDVNGDGYDDVLVGAHEHDEELVNEGRAYLYLGAAGGLAVDPAWIGSGDQTQALYGQIVASAGDVNADGYDDVLVGAPTWDNGQIDEGGAFLYLGSSAGLAAAASWVGEGNQDLATFGWAVGTAGDVNADGFDDLLVGAPRFDSIVASAGRAFLYLGSGDGPSATPAWTADGEETGDFFAGYVSAAGDVNGDGAGDVAVGALASDGTDFLEGRAFVYHGVKASAFLLRVTPTGSGSGTVTSVPPGIDCGADCSEIYNGGTTVTLSAVAAAGSVFAGWNGDADCVDGVVDVIAAASCTAFFPLEQDFCFDLDGDGFGSPAGASCTGGVALDCDDSCPDCFPGAVELCDGLDNSCDGDVDRILCDRFDVNGDGMIDGVELAWLGRAFGSSSPDPAAEWWAAIEYTGDGLVDGDDLGLLSTVWFCEGTRDVCQGR